MGSIGLRLGLSAVLSGPGEGLGYLHWGHIYIYIHIYLWVCVYICVYI